MLRNEALLSNLPGVAGVLGGFPRPRERKSEKSQNYHRAAIRTPLRSPWQSSGAIRCRNDFQEAADISGPTITGTIAGQTTFSADGGST
jgi:hypothetical protein